MYINLLGSLWCTESFQQLFKDIRENYKIHALTLQHDKITYPTFRERCITHVVIEAGNAYVSFPVHKKLTEKDYQEFSLISSKFMDAHPVNKHFNEMHKAVKTEIETTLGIDNNVDVQKDTKVTYCLNDYTPEERAKMIAFLATVDSNSPEVFIAIDLATCTKAQAEYLSNHLLCVEASAKA